MSRAETALMSLYEDASLRGDLIDSDADRLLKWAEAQIVRLDAESPDDAAFEAGIDALRGLVKTMNRFAGRSADRTPDENAAALGRMSEDAAAIGRPVQAAAFAPPVPDPDDALRSFSLGDAEGASSQSTMLAVLIGWIDGATPASADMPADSSTDGDMSPSEGDAAMIDPDL
jgi:hypothetical protein